MSDERFDRIDQKFTEVDRRFDRVEQRLDGVDQRLDGLKADMDTGFAELRRHMGVLHEEVLDRIAATRESPATVQDTPAESKDEIGRRLDPLEALVPVVREHGATLKRHDAEIDRLKQAGG